MKNKPTIHKTSLAFAVAIVVGQFAIGNLAQARAVDDWGYWDAPTAAGPGSVGNDGFDNYSADNTNTTQNNTGRNFNGDQRIFGANPSISTASAEQGSFVGYTLCYAGCDGDVNNFYYNRQPKTAGTVSIDITQGPERVAERSQYISQGYDWTNGLPYYIADYSYYDAQVAVNGTFNGADFNLNSSQASIEQAIENYYFGGVYSYTSVRAENENSGFYANISSSGKGEGDNSVFYGQISTNTSYGNVLFGKPIVATQIAEQLRLGQTYNFYGSSYNGSNVQIAVNFQNASWSGSWGQTYDYSNFNYQTGSYKTIQNGFSAAGGISGSTLTSNSVVGAGNVGVGFVTGGKVDATLVGAIKGTDASAAAVIGKTVVTVQQSIGTTTVGDVFQAYGPRGEICKGDCLR